MNPVAPLAVAHCPLCGSKLIAPLYTITRFEDPFTIFRCESCLFQFMNPLPSAEKEAALYTEGYYTGQSSYSYIDERKTELFSRHVWKARLSTIRRYVKQGTLIDIGCSFGGFIDFASRYFSCRGVESSAYACDYAKKRGMCVEKARAEDMDIGENSADIITMIEVIEHTRDPLLVLRKCAASLRNSGLLVVQTADLHSWQAIEAAEKYHYYLPGHFSYFTGETITNALLAAGFTSVKIFRPVDFGLIPKLKKMRGSFTRISDYLRCINTAVYHFKGYFKKRGIPLTGSMVVYAFRSRS